MNSFTRLLIIDFVSIIQKKYSVCTCDAGMIHETRRVRDVQDI
jgi:hypothetical protein